MHQLQKMRQGDGNKTLHAIDATHQESQIAVLVTSSAVTKNGFQHHFVGKQSFKITNRMDQTILLAGTTIPENVDQTVVGQCYQRIGVISLLYFFVIICLDLFGLFLGRFLASSFRHGGGC